jgi:hypothetical protein
MDTTDKTNSVLENEDEFIVLALLAQGLDRGRIGLELARLQGRDVQSAMSSAAYYIGQLEVKFGFPRPDPSAWSGIMASLYQ